MEFNSFDSSGQVLGFPMGALSEIAGSQGSGKTEMILRFLAENPGFRVAWVEEQLDIYPCAFPQKDVALQRVLFVDASGSAANSSSQSTTPGEKSSLWVVHQILQSQAFDVVVLSTSIPEKDAAVLLRRLQLSAEKNRCSVILLKEMPTRWASWAIRLQVQVERSPVSGEPQVKVLKNKNSMSSLGQTEWQAKLG